MLVMGELGVLPQAFRNLVKLVQVTWKIYLLCMNILYLHVFNADINLTGFDDSVELSSSGTETNLSVVGLMT